MIKTTITGMGFSVPDQIIKNEDLDIRIVAYKDGEQLGKLTFIVKTKN